MDDIYYDGPYSYLLKDGRLVRYVICVGEQDIEGKHGWRAIWYAPSLIAALGIKERYEERCKTAIRICCETREFIDERNTNEDV